MSPSLSRLRVCVLPRFRSPVSCGADLLARRRHPTAGCSPRLTLCASPTARCSTRSRSFARLHVHDHRLQAALASSSPEPVRGSRISPQGVSFLTNSRARASLSLSFSISPPLLTERGVERIGRSATRERACYWGASSCSAAGSRVLCARVCMDM